MSKPILAVTCTLGLAILALGFATWQFRNQSLEQFDRAETAQVQAGLARATSDTAQGGATWAHGTADAAQEAATSARATADAAGTISAASVATTQAGLAFAGATADAEQFKVGQTEQAAHSAATRAMIRETEQARTLSCDKPIDLTLIPANQTYFMLHPGGAETAIPVDEKGAHSLSIKTQDSILFHYHPSTEVEIFYVKCLFVQVFLLNSNPETPATFDFALWYPAKSGWSTNDGKNTLGWGENLIEVESPDDVVSRGGDIYFVLRDNGTTNAQVLQLGFTLVLLNSHGTERTIRTTANSAQ